MTLYVPDSVEQHERRTSTSVLIASPYTIAS